MASGGAMLSMPRAPSSQYHPRVLATGGGVPRRVASRSHSSAAAHSQRALLSDSEPPAAVEASGASPSATAPGGNAATYERDLLSIAEGVCAATGGVGGAAAAQVVDRSWHASLASPSPLASHTGGEPMPMPQLRLVAPLSAYEGPMGTKAAADRLLSLRSSEAEFARNMASQQSRGRGRGSGGGGALALVAKKREEDLAANQIISDQVIALWEAAEALQSSPATTNTLSSSTSFPTPAASSSSLSNASLALISSSASAALGDRIRLSLAAAVAAVSSGAHDDDVLKRIVVSLRRDCVAADAAIRPDRGTATAGAAKSSGDSSPPIRLSYFAQSLVRICAAASAAALPSLASCLAQTLANDLTEGAHRIHQENAVADSGDGDVGSEAIRQWLRGASDAFVELNVCLDALRKSSGSGGSAVGGGAENKEKQKGGGTAKGAGGHLARSAALRDSGVGTAAAISAAVDFLAAYASAAAVLITFEATNASSSSATTREEKNATPILPPPAAPLVSHIIGLAEQLGSFAVLEATHAGLVAALPYLLTPPTSRAAAAAAEEEDSVFSAAEAMAASDVGSSEGLRAAAGDAAEATRASANHLAAAREAIAEIIVDFRPPSSSVLEAADVFGGSIFLDMEEEGGLEGGGALAPRLLVDYYASILRAVATISQQNAEAVVVATTLVVADAEAEDDPSFKNNNKPTAAANELRPPHPANKEKGSVCAAAQRNVTASAAALSGDAIDVLSIVLAVERPTSHDAALGAHLTRLAQTARTALSATAGALARTCPARILALYEGSRTVGDDEGIGPIGAVAALRPSGAVMDAYVATGRYDEAIATLALIGGAKPDGWAAPPSDVLAAAHRLSLAVGQFGAPRHVAALVPAIYSFRSQHMWLGVFLDYCTAGLAVRVKAHADLCADLAAKAAASSQHFTATFAGGEAAARQRAADAAIVAARDMIVAVALQRSADTSADPLLELLQECCWHPHPRAAPLLVNAVVDNFDHLFAAYPLTYRYKAVDASTVPREHKSRSGGWQGQGGGGGHHLVAPATVCAETTMRLAGGSYLRHSVLAFLRDNKQTALFEELVAAWQRPAEEVARLLSRAPDSAPAAQLWECRSCKRLSNARYMYCSCSALRFGSVICPSCGLGQAETNGGCVACGYSFAAEGAITDEMVVPRAPWTCAGCGCANSPYQTIFCGRCKTATGPLAVALGATPQTCSSCSSTNELGFGLYPACVDCGAPSPAFSLAKNDAKSADEQQQQPLKAWQCDGCGEWSPTSLSRCPHCPYVELRGASPVRDVAPIGCSACGVLNTNGLLAHCCACDAPLVASAPTTVALCTECFTANAKDAASCASCEAVFVRETSSSPSTTVKTAADGAPPPNPNHIVVKSFFRFCKSCSSPVSPYNLSCVCDRCDAFLPFFTTATGEPVPDTAPDAVGVVATCETILRRIDREPESIIIPIAEGFLVELTAASEETIAIARPLLTDVIVHFGHVFRLDSLIGCRGLALSLALAHHCRCEITEGRLVELDRRVVTAFNKQREHDAQRTAHPLLEALAPIASFVAGSSSAATAHNTASLLFCASVANATPGEGARVVAAADVESEEEKHLSRHTRDDEQLCSKCLSPHKESMCRFNDCGWQCGGCGESLTNRNGLDAVLCPKCYQVRPELEECIEVWQCPQCGRCSPDTELFCLFCETHKEVAARGRPEGVYALPFLPVVCGRCSRPHLEALCPHCTAIPPTRVKEGLGTVTVATERYVFLQPLGTSAPEDRVFVPIQLAGELFVDQQVIFDAEEGKPGQLKATRVAPFDD